MCVIQSKMELPGNCADHYQNGHTDNGIYTVFVGSTMRHIYCYMISQPWTSPAVSLHLSFTCI